MNPSKRDMGQQTTVLETAYDIAKSTARASAVSRVDRGTVTSQLVGCSCKSNFLGSRFTKPYPKKWQSDTTQNAMRWASGHVDADDYDYWRKAN